MPYSATSTPSSLWERIPGEVERVVLEARARKGGVWEYQAEWAACKADPTHFIRAHVKIFDPDVRAWIPFDLWPAQEEVLALLRTEPRLAILKARALGMTWLVLAFYLWEMLFNPIVEILLFSKGDTEAMALMGRLTGMYEHLPMWIRQHAPIGETDNAHTWSLSNSSTARAFPTNTGDSFQGTHGLMDEFDLVENQDKFLNKVDPALEKGKLVCLSRVDKSRPQTRFKKMYIGAKRGENKWRSVFLPWHARPDRTAEWYEAQKRDIEANTGALDDLHEQYPATDTEAISPRSLDKRIPPAWLQQCYEPMVALDVAQEARNKVNGADTPTPPAIPGLLVYKLPEPGREYRMAGDPAEGIPGRDDSSLHVVDRATGEEVAMVAGCYDPDVFAAHTVSVGTWYNMAEVLPERNNHGHAYINAMRSRGHGAYIMRGLDGKRGWNTTQATKAYMYDKAAIGFRQGDATIHSEKTYLQLASIDSASLSAPDKERDDCAVSYVLAYIARTLRRAGDTV